MTESRLHKKAIRLASKLVHPTQWTLHLTYLGAGFIHYSGVISWACGGLFVVTFIGGLLPMIDKENDHEGS